MSALDNTTSTIVYTKTAQGVKMLPLLEQESKDEESAVEYRRGGYLPISIGDKFSQERYIVVRKLGWGHFSTVWLVKDTQADCHLALKVVKSAQRYAETAFDEIKMLKQIQETDPNHSGHRHIVKLLDSFEHVTRTASHLCMVFEPLGETLLTLLDRNRKQGVEKSLVKSIIKQILLGLAFLHEQCDLAHTDIKPENILISLPNPEQYIRSELLSSAGPSSRHVGIPIEPRKGSSTTVRRVDRARDRVRIFDSQPLPSPISSRSSFGHSPIDEVGRLLSAVRVARTSSPGSTSGIPSPSDTMGFSTAPTSFGSVRSKLLSRSQASISEALCSDQFTPKSITAKQIQKPSLLAQTAPAILSTSPMPSVQQLLTVKEQDLLSLPSDTEDTPSQNGQFLSPPHLPAMLLPSENAEVTIKIADLGNATPSKVHYTEDIQTRQYRAPEAILGRTDWDTKADLWSVACLTFELLTGDVLFDPQSRANQFTKDDDHMAMIIELLQEDWPFDLDYRMGGRYSRELFNSHGQLRYIQELHSWPLRKVMVEKYLWPATASESLCDFLLPMLAINPKDRSSATQMLEHEWLQDAIQPS